MELSAGAVLTGLFVALSELGKSVKGAALSEAMRGKALFSLADGGVASFWGATGLTAGAAPVEGLACWAASFCFDSGDRA